MAITPTQSPERSRKLSSTTSRDRSPIATARLKTLTDFSIVYVGNSGAPFDYVYAAGAGSGSGDANADGQSQNDLVYVPKDAHDPNEILFQGFNAAPGSAAQ